MKYFWPFFRWKTKPSIWVKMFSFLLKDIKINNMYDLQKQMDFSILLHFIYIPFFWSNHIFTFIHISFSFISFDIYFFLCFFFPRCPWEWVKIYMYYVYIMQDIRIKNKMLNFFRYFSIVAQETARQRRRFWSVYSVYFFNLFNLSLPPNYVCRGSLICVNITHIEASSPSFKWFV